MSGQAIDHPEESAPLPLMYSVGYWWARLRRGMTLGTRTIVLDDKNQVFLVRHSYTKGWHLPGGGVEGGETFLESMKRELLEEANITVVGEPHFHGICLNRRLSRRDHIAIYVVRQFEQPAPRAPDWEIVECGFFPIDHMPSDTTRGTVARIREIVDGHPCHPFW